VAYRDLEPVSKQLTIVVGLTVVGFMAFGLALSFYRNVLFEQTLARLSDENRALQNENIESQWDLDYYLSTQYRDKYAKESLDKVNPGEKVLLLNQPPKAPDFTFGDSLTPTEQQQAAYEEHLRGMPVFEHWVLYLFEREKLEELQRGL